MSRLHAGDAAETVERALLPLRGVVAVGSRGDGGSLHVGDVGIREIGDGAVGTGAGARPVPRVVDGGGAGTGVDRTLHQAVEDVPRGVVGIGQVK